MKNFLFFTYLLVVGVLFSCKSTTNLTPTNNYGYQYTTTEGDGVYSIVTSSVRDTSRLFYGYNGKDSTFYIFNPETDEVEQYIVEKTRYAVVTADTYYLIRFESKD